MQYPTIAQPQFAFAPTFAKGGLADAAQAVQSQGRGKDTMLVHMTPNEVKGLQALAKASGGSLTINPSTGLPEAGILDMILPLAAGFALGPAGFALMSAPAAALTVGGVTALATGDLMKGLSAGLGAFGGANLGATLSSTGTQALQSQAMTDEVARQVAQDAATVQAQSTLAGTALAPTTAAAPLVGSQAGADAILAAAQNAPTGFSSLGAGVKDIATPGGLGRFGSTFAQSAGGPFGTTAATMGLAQPVMAVMQPKPYDFSAMPTERSSYEGPYLPTEREVRYPTMRDSADSSEFQYFTPSNPYPGFRTATASDMTQRFQEGGEVDRAVRVAPAEFRGGVDPEFQHNFRPIEVYTPPPQAEAPLRGLPAMLAGKGARNRRMGGEGSDEGSINSFDPIGRVFARRFADKVNPRPLNAPTGMSAKDAEKYGYDRYTNLAGYKFDPLTQRMVPANMASGGLAALNAFSRGGVSLDDGAFVVDARTVSELGNGSSEAGQERLARLGGKPIKGPGDGVSDSIPATIGGTQPARVARDEVVFDDAAVRRMGGGSVKSGAKKLYAMMDKVHDERKKAKRGQNTKAAKHMPA